MIRTYLTLLTLVLAAPCFAHSGAAAICLPVSGITVDGEHADWPDDLPHYPIQRQGGFGETLDPSDMEAWFQIGCNVEENALYIAIDVVQDESTIIDTSAAGRDLQQDGTDIRINVGHAEGDSTGLHQYGLWGTRLRLLKQGPLTDKEAVQAAVSRRRRQGHRYEWRVDLSRLGDGTFRLAEGAVIGLDVEVMDRDAEDDKRFSYYTWGPIYEGRSRDSYYFLGDAVVATNASRVARLAGHVGWDEADLTAPSRLSITSVANDSMSVELSTDDAGDYAIELPAGEYRVAVIEVGDSDLPANLNPESNAQRERTLELTAGDTHVVDLKNRLNVGAQLSDSTPDTVVAGPGSRQGLWYTISEADGLPGGVISLAQDEEGALWIGTTQGLFHYDGEIITRMFNTRLPTGAVVDDSGHVWFAHTRRQRDNSGVGHWDGENLTRYGVERGLPSTSIYDIHVATDGTVWVGTRRGMARWRDGRFESIEAFADVSVFDIEEDQKGALLVAHTGGVRRWSDADRSEDIAIADNGSLINNVLDDGHGGTWVASLELTLESVTDGRLRFVSDAGTDELPDALAGPRSIWDMLQDRRGTLWLASARGLLRWDGQELTTFTSLDGLGADQANCLLEDREGHLWVGTASGLSRYDGEHLLSLRVADGLSDYIVRGLVEDGRGDLWLSTARGIDRYDGRSVTSQYRRHNTEQQRWWRTGSDLVSDGNGKVWFVVDDGVTGCGGDGQCRSWTLADGLASPMGAYALWPSRDDGVWVGPNVGIQRLRGNSLETWTAEDGLPQANVLSVAEGDGDVWFGTQSGVARLRDGTITAVGQPGRWIPRLQMDTAGRLWGRWVTSAWNRAGAFVLADTIRTWSDNDTYQFLRSGETMLTDTQAATWFGTETGLLRIDDDGERLFSTVDGLPSNRIWSLAKDDDDVLWIGTGAGLCRYDGRVFRTLTRREGLAQNGVTDILQVNNGDMWVATLGGVTRLRRRHTPPGVRLVSVLADQDYGAVDAVRVPASQNSIRFKFAGRSLYTAADEMMYYYRLDGVDDDWKQTQSTSVEYAGLPDGPLRFEVMAVDADLNYSEPAFVDVSFAIAWAQYLLYGGLALSVFGLVLASGYGLRSRRDAEQARQAQSQALHERNTALEAANQHLREMDALKSDFVSNVSHELRTPLTSIKGSVDNMLDGITGDLNDKQSRYLSRVQSNANRLSRLVDDLLDLSRIEAGRLELRPTNIDVAQIGRDVVGSLQTLAADKQITLAITTSGQTTAWADADRVHQVLVNLVGNAVKFTPDGGQVDVRVGADGGQVTIAVSDNGPGIEPDQLLTIFDKFHQVGSGADRQGAGLGLAISQRLVELHGGTLHVDSEAGVGSTFTFTLPVNPGGEGADHA